MEGPSVATSPTLKRCLPPKGLDTPSQETAAKTRMDDSKVGDTVELFGGREGPRAFALIALTNDWADHYSAAAMYLRLNGLLPPTAQEKKK